MVKNWNYQISISNFPKINYIDVRSEYRKNLLRWKIERLENENYKRCLFQILLKLII